MHTIRTKTILHSSPCAERTIQVSEAGHVRQDDGLRAQLCGVESGKETAGSPNGVPRAGGDAAASCSSTTSSDADRNFGDWEQITESQEYLDDKIKQKFENLKHKNANKEPQMESVNPVAGITKYDFNEAEISIDIDENVPTYFKMSYPSWIGSRDPIRWFAIPAHMEPHESIYNTLPVFVKAHPCPRYPNGITDRDIVRDEALEHVLETVFPRWHDYTEDEQTTISRHFVVNMPQFSQPEFSRAGVRLQCLNSLFSRPTYAKALDKIVRDVTSHSPEDDILRSVNGARLPTPETFAHAAAQGHVRGMCLRPDTSALRCSKRDNSRGYVISHDGDLSRYHLVGDSLWLMRRVHKRLRRTLIAGEYDGDEYGTIAQMLTCMGYSQAEIANMAQEVSRNHELPFHIIWNHYNNVAYNEPKNYGGLETQSDVDDIEGVEFSEGEWYKLQGWLSLLADNVRFSGNNPEGWTGMDMLEHLYNFNQEAAFRALYHQSNHMHISPNDVARFATFVAYREGIDGGYDSSDDRNFATCPECDCVRPNSIISEAMDTHFESQWGRAPRPHHVVWYRMKPCVSHALHNGFVQEMRIALSGGDMVRLVIAMYADYFDFIEVPTSMFQPTVKEQNDWLASINVVSQSWFAVEHTVAKEPLDAFKTMVASVQSMCNKMSDAFTGVKDSGLAKPLVDGARFYSWAKESLMSFITMFGATMFFVFARIRGLLKGMLAESKKLISLMLDMVRSWVPAKYTGFVDALSEFVDDSAKDDESETCTQSVFDTPLEGIVKTLVVALFVSGFGTTKMSKDTTFVDGLYKRLGSFGRTRDGIDNFVSWLSENVTTLFNGILEYLGFETQAKVRTGMSDIDQWQDSVFELKKDFDNGRLPQTSEGYSRIMIVEAEGDRLLNMYAKFPLVRRLMLVRKLLSPLREAFSTFTIGSPISRAEPYWLYMSGPSGCGKSHLTKLIIAGLLQECFPDMDWSSEVATKNMVYYWMNSSERQDAYRGQPAVIIDDVLCETEAPGTASEAINLIRMVSSAVMPMEAADIALKGRLYFAAKLIVSSSNRTCFTNCHSIFYPEALERRMHHWMMAPKEEFCVEHKGFRRGRDEKAIMSRRLDVSKVQSAFDFDVIEFFPVRRDRPGTATQLEVGEPVSFGEFFRLVVEDIKAHQARMDSATEVVSDVISHKRVDYKPVESIPMKYSGPELSSFGSICRDANGVWRPSTAMRDLVTQSDVEDFDSATDGEDDVFCLDAVPDVDYNFDEKLRMCTTPMKEALCELYGYGAVDQLELELGTLDNLLYNNHVMATVLRRLNDQKSPGVKYAKGRYSYTSVVFGPKGYGGVKLSVLGVPDTQNYTLQNLVELSKGKVSAATIRGCKTAFARRMSKKIVIERGALREARKAEEEASTDSPEVKFIQYSKAVVCFVVTAFSISTAFSAFKKVKAYVNNKWNFGASETQSDADSLTRGTYTRTCSPWEAKMIKHLQGYKWDDGKVNAYIARYRKLLEDHTEEEAKAIMMGSPSAVLYTQDGCSGDPHLDIINCVVDRNMYFLVVNIGDPNKVRVRVTMVKGRMGIFTKHTIGVLETFPPDTTVSLIKVLREEEVFKYSVADFVSMCTTLEGKTVDLAGIHFTKPDLNGRNMPEHKNIINHFGKAGPRNPSINLVVPRLNVADGRRVTYLAVKEFKGTKSHSSAQVKDKATKSVIDVGAHIYYHSKTYPGDCGALCFSVSGPNAKIVGLHSAGNARDFGLSTQVDADVVNALIDRMENVDYDGLSLQSYAWESFIYQGEFPKRLGYQQSSKLLRSVFYGTWCSCPYIEAPLVPFTVNGELIDPVIESLIHYDTVRPTSICSETLEKATRAVMLHFRKLLVGYDRGTVDYETTVLGYRTLSSANRKSSLGPSHTELGQGKYKLFGDGVDFEFGPAWTKFVREWLDPCRDKLRNGQRPEFYAKHCLKDEPRPKEKALKKGGTRAIFAYDYHFKVLCDHFLATFLDAVNENGFSLGIATRANMRGNDATLIYNKLRGAMGENGYCCAGDFSKYDATMITEVKNCVKEVIMDFYVGDDLDDNVARRLLLDELTKSKVIIDSSVYEFTKGTASGHPLTTIYNSIYHLVVMNYCYIRHVETSMKMDFHESGCDFWRDFCIFVYGDDQIFSGNLERNVYMHEGVVAKYAAELGMVYTREDKTVIDADDLPPMRKVEECTFLKRSFRFEPALGRIVAPLELQVVLRIGMLVNDTSDETLTSCITTLIEELSLHGQEIYEKWSTEIEIAIRSHGFGVPYSQWIMALRVTMARGTTALIERLEEADAALAIRLWTDEKIINARLEDMDESRRVKDLETQMDAEDVVGQIHPEVVTRGSVQVAPAEITEVPTPELEHRDGEIPILHTITPAKDALHVFAPLVDGSIAPGTSPGPITTYYLNMSNLVASIQYFGHAMTFADGIRGDIELRLVIKASPFCSGIMKLGFLPDMSYDQLPRIRNDETLAAISQWPGPTMDTSRQSQMEMVIPYMQGMRFASQNVQASGWGRVQLWMLTPFRDPSKSLTWTLFMRFRENVKLFVPSSRPNLTWFAADADDTPDDWMDIVQTYDPYDDPFVTDEDFDIAEMFTETPDLGTVPVPSISKIAETFKTIAGTQAKIPFYNKSPSLIQSGLDVLKGAAYMCGWAKERPSDVKFHMAALGPYGYFQNVMGPMETYTMSASTHNEVLPHSEFDHMNIKYVSQIPMLYLVRDADLSTLEPRDLIFSAEFKPSMHVTSTEIRSSVQGDQEYEYRTKGGMGIVASMFNYYSGEICFKLQVAKNKFQRLIIKAVASFSIFNDVADGRGQYGIDQNNYTSANLFELIDFNEDLCEVSFRLPNYHLHHAVPIDQQMCRVNFFLVDAQFAPQADARCDLMLWVMAGETTQFHSMDIQIAAPVLRTGTEAPVGPQSLSDLHVEDLKPFGNVPITGLSDTFIATQLAGEHIKSLKSVIQQGCLMGVTNVVDHRINPFAHGAVRISFGLIDTFRYPMDAVALMAACYCFASGSMIVSRFLLDPEAEQMTHTITAGSGIGNFDVDGNTKLYANHRIMPYERGNTSRTIIKNNFPQVLVPAHARDPWWQNVFFNATDALYRNLLVPSQPGSRVRLATVTTSDTVEQSGYMRAAGPDYVNSVWRGCGLQLFKITNLTSNNNISWDPLPANYYGGVLNPN